MGAGKDEDRLIRVCQQYLLIIPLWPRVESDNRPLPFFNLFDHPAAIYQNRNPDSISDRGNIAGGFALFQLAAQLTNDKALFGGVVAPWHYFDGKKTGLGFNDQTL